MVGRRPRHQHRCQRPALPLLAPCTHLAARALLGRVLVVAVLIVMEGGSVRGKGKEPYIGESSSAAACEWVVTTDVAVKLSQQLGEGVVVPRGRDIDEPLLNMNYEDLQTRMDQYKEDWGRFGVTIILHAMMKEKIGGELVRWNATRFGTLFLFLQSFWDRQDKFQAWMVSSDWKNNDWRDEKDHKFTYGCLIDRIWWEKIEMVLKTVTPLYYVLRFVDQQKNGTISAFLTKMLSAQAEIFAKLKHDKNVKRDFMKKVNEIIRKRTQYLLNDTLMLEGSALDPKSLYTSKLATHHSAILAVTLTIKKLAHSPIESIAIDQFTRTFSKKREFIWITRGSILDTSC
ncbi:hypothetical protein ZEAMMB73_Zm00001d003995 [Zea mays]|uniref:Uncharacterized protein n=1 Tax=Zea mays TaxID=4577 RepID=A0A1D6ECU7_MAIZE|nr:hypothetical protein ZEAMMB73_Zm00001d003995 [Zea mays]ONM18124.1 hypothetical protein ZEAMMB73_Zm00001d003995 [Zea mays]